MVNPSLRTSDPHFSSNARVRLSFFFVEGGGAALLSLDAMRLW